MKEQERENNILRNRAIIRTIHNHRSRRRKYAIYRLYRYCNLSPQEIVALLQDDFAFWNGKVWPCDRNRHFYNQLTYIRKCIGQVFSELCIKDQKCVFRKFLKK